MKISFWWGAGEKRDKPKPRGGQSSPETITDPKPT